MSGKTHLTETYKNILVSEIENPKGLKVGLIQLNRPEALNALNNELMSEVVSVLEAFDKSNETGCTVLTGNAKAFAAGADIKDRDCLPAHRPPRRTRRPPGLHRVPATHWAHRRFQRACDDLRYDSRGRRS